MKHNKTHEFFGWHRGSHHGHGRYLKGPEGHSHRGEGRGHGGRRGRMGRFFEHGDLKLVALQLIAEKPRHGYEIIKAIEEKSNGAYTPSAGAIYPTLTLLQEMGHLSVSDSDDGRKLYALTDEGAAALAANRKAVDAVFAYIGQARGERSSGSSLKEAFHKLRNALRTRLAQGPLDDEQLKTIIGKLNEASEAISQS